MKGFACDGRYGLAGSSNTTGDDQKKLDVLANELFINMLKASYTIYAMASEENENLIEVEVPKQVRPGDASRVDRVKTEMRFRRVDTSFVLIRWMARRTSIAS